ncbi:serine/threonine-protein kinase [Natrinema salaciae]|uniref:Serine/threonine protein kinase n=1 Tax=Natrinema salaciae TaxID=1186196 RepID=A0A1H9MAU2_9EURY|nr:serine/threonine-protein kinase [Natrinema salaciae]SER20263.1 serine/threonine protein kinase [Natrinema salaciae]
MTGDERIGSLVDGRFRLEERIDAGGLATVWRATDRERGTAVALKCENDGPHDRAQVRAHFRGELRWFRRFDGGPVPGSLVRFVDGAVGGDTGYVATELIRGGSLGDLVAREAEPNRPLPDPLERVRELGGPVCRALAFLHRNGVAHLDLKPSNVLVRRSGRPAVIDLNAAVATETDPDICFERDPFKPPELTLTDARDAPIGPRCDVYALGAVLAFLLTGTASAGTAASIGAWEPVDPQSGDADCPSALAGAIRRATAPDHRDRFDDADELYDALVPVLEVPNRSARLVHEPSGRTVRVRPGDTLGRWAADRRVPTVVLPDDERFCCPEHAVLEHDGSDWRLRDRSLNGTYVRGDGDWEYVLSRDGCERRRDADAPLPRPDPLASIRLSDGDRIAPVSPEYGCRLVFRTGD